MSYRGPSSGTCESSEAMHGGNTKPRSGVSIPSLGLSLGWLQGILRRALSLGILLNLMLLLLGAFQAKNTNPSDKKPDPNHENLASLLNQRWVVRKRNRRGQLRHIKTYDQPPSREELAQHGSGSYSILTTKPSLRLWESLKIADNNRIVTQTPRPSHPQKNFDISPVSLKEGTEVKKPKKRLILKRKVRMPAEELPAKAEMSVKPVKADIDSATTTILPATQRIMPEPIQKSSSEMCGDNQDLAKRVREERCSKCLEVPSSLIRCGFCKEIFCNDSLDECYENHECNGSKVCHKCGRRVPNVLVEMAELCHLSFCSLKCENECRRRNLMKLGCVGCTPGSDDENEKKEVDVKMDEGGGYEKETSPEEEESIEEEDVEETCGGRPKKIACRRCQRDNCQGRFCDGYCDRCRFHCQARCENDGECKFCTEFDSCMIRCIEAPDRCDKKHCRGFRCEDRWASGTECDEECKGCGEEGCYFFGRQEDGGPDDEE